MVYSCFQVVYSLPHIQLHRLCHALHSLRIDMLLPTLHNLCNGLPGRFEPK
jgi:fumarate reductase subunit D